MWQCPGAPEILHSTEIPNLNIYFGVPEEWGSTEGGTKNKLWEKSLALIRHVKIVGIYFSEVKKRDERRVCKIICDRKRIDQGLLPTHVTKGSSLRLRIPIINANKTKDATNPKSGGF